MYNNLGIYDSVVEFFFPFYFHDHREQNMVSIVTFLINFLKINNKQKEVKSRRICVLCSYVSLAAVLVVSSSLTACWSTGLCTGSLYQGFLRERLEWSYVNVWSYIFASWCKLECCFQFKFESTITLRCFIWYFTSIPHIARPKCLCLVVN